jgi:hypothetical protein
MLDLYSGEIDFMEATVIVGSDYFTFGVIDINGELIRESAILIKIADLIIYRRVDTISSLGNHRVSKVPYLHVQIIAGHDCVIVDKAKPRYITDVTFKEIVWTWTSHHNTWFGLIFII